MKIKKLSSPPEPEEVQSMVNYARNVIEEFRKAKHFRHILCTMYQYFLIIILLTTWSFSTQLTQPNMIRPIVTVPWHSGTPQWSTGDVWAQHGEDGSHICRHQCLHVAYDVPGYGRLPLHAGLEWSHELWREDRTAIQVKWWVTLTF